MFLIGLSLQKICNEFLTTTERFLFAVIIVDFDAAKSASSVTNITPKYGKIRQKHSS
jgi:hypothetical protein